MTKKEKLLKIQEAYYELLIKCLPRGSVQDYQNVCTNAPIYLKELLESEKN